jgi:hypothetical protein
MDDVEHDHALADLGVKGLKRTVALGMGAPDLESRLGRGH